MGRRRFTEWRLLGQNAWEAWHGIQGMDNKYNFYRCKRKLYHDHTLYPLVGVITSKDFFSAVVLVGLNEISTFLISDV